MNNITSDKVTIFATTLIISRMKCRISEFVIVFCKVNLTLERNSGPSAQQVFARTCVRIHVDMYAFCRHVWMT